MENALSPREIQTRIRAGATVEQVAQETGMPVEQVEPFATPVLAERQHQVTTALASPVRRRGETGSNRTLEAVVDERLRTRGLRADDVEWDAWRTEDRLWVVVGHYEVDGADDSGRSHFEPQWRFDPRARYSTALNDDARWLIGELPPVGAPVRRRGGMDPDAEPTVDLNDEMALIRATQDAAEMTIPLPASIRQRALNPQQGEDLTQQPGRAQQDAAPGDFGDDVPGGDVPGDGVHGAAGARGDGPSPAHFTGAAEIRVTEVQYVQEAFVTGSPEASPADDAQDALPQPEQRDGEQLAGDQLAGRGAGGDDGYGEEYVDTELEQVDGVYDFVPSHTSNLDTLYEMLSGFQEDSVNIYAGLDQLPPVAPGTQGPDVRDLPGAEGDAVAPDASPANRQDRGAGRHQTGFEASSTARDNARQTMASRDAAARDHLDAASVDPTSQDTAALFDTSGPSGAVHQDARPTGGGYPADELPAADARRSPSEPEAPGEHPAASPAQQATPALPTTRVAQPGSPTDDTSHVATGWPATMGQEREPETTLENPVEQTPAPVTEERTPTPAVTDEPAGLPDAGTPEREIADTEAALTPAPEPQSAAEPQVSAPTVPHRAVPADGVHGRNAPLEPEQDPLVEEPTQSIKPRPKTRKRASVPTWDEIMFGGPR